MKFNNKKYFLFYCALIILIGTVKLGSNLLSKEIIKKTLAIESSIVNETIQEIKIKVISGLEIQTKTDIVDRINHIKSNNENGLILAGNNFTNAIDIDKIDEILKLLGDEIVYQNKYYYLTSKEKQIEPEKLQIIKKNLSWYGFQEIENSVETFFYDVPITLQNLNFSNNQNNNINQLTIGFINKTEKNEIINDNNITNVVMINDPNKIVNDSLNNSNINKFNGFINNKMIKIAKKEEIIIINLKSKEK